MIKFIDKTTGNLYNGSKPSYVFWFDGEQSTNIYYSQIILFMSDKSSINFKLPKTDIFSFIDPKILDDIRGIDSFTTNINEIIYKEGEKDTSDMEEHRVSANIDFINNMRKELLSFSKGV